MTKAGARFTIYKEIYAVSHPGIARSGLRKRGLKTCTTLRAAIIACVICAALLALTSANILFPGLSLAVFVLSSMPVLLMMIGLIAGLLLGANLGVLVAALLRAGREEE